MSTRFKIAVRFVLVTVGIVVLTSLSVDATDALRGSQSALGIFARFATESTCPDGMVVVRGETSAYCIDVYENGVGATCPFPEPFSVSDTASNASAVGCSVVSAAGVQPWRFVSRTQAEQLCARVGKRLPTAHEWYQAALGTVDTAENCNSMSGTLSRTGSKSACRSGIGAFDMVGNVWELTTGQVQNGTLDMAVLPPSGYVAEIGRDGLASDTTSTPQQLFNDDYVWTNATGTYAVMRGGYYGSRADGGLYSMQAAVANSFASAAVGFRCVKSL